MKAIADALRTLADAVEAYRPPAPKSEDPYVDRNTCGISKRAWDRGVSSGEFKAVKDGRRWIAKRESVTAWLERERVVEDEDEALYRRSGITRK
jgi:hypothetical protein